MSTPIRDEKVNVKLFIEEIDLSGDVLTPTGFVVEVPFFNSIVWKTSLDFQKSATITFNDGLKKFTRSLRHPDKLIPSVQLEDSDLQSYCKDLYAKYHDKIQTYGDTVELNSELFLLDFEHVLGVDALDSFVYTESNKPLCFRPTQRIWIATESYVMDASGDSKLDKKYSIWSGMISGFTEVDSETDSTVTIAATGLSRFLDMTHIFENYRLAAFKGDLIESYMSVLNENLYSRFSGLQMLTALKPMSYALLPAFLANYFYTAQGNAIDYGTSTEINNDFFLQDVLWKLNVDSDNCWDALVNGSEGAALGKLGQEDIAALTEELFSGDQVRVYDLLPSVHVDPLILEIFNDPSISIMSTLLQQSFALIDDASITGKELLIKAAQNILCSAYEDDFGNICFEASRVWSAPKDPNGFITNYNYRKSEYASILGETEHDSEYIISDIDFYTSTKAFNEANMVTHVLVPCGFNFNMENGEYVKNTALTGGTDADDEDVLSLQRKYGVRGLTTEPLALAQINLGKDQEAFMLGLGTFAKMVLQLRNYSAVALSMNCRFLSHLGVGKNVLVLSKEILALINDKTMSYSVSEESASYTCDFILTYSHRISDEISYPFFDIVLGD